MTFYLTYRPQTINELDLTKVRNELSLILNSGRFAKAYIFAGTRGTGKTSAARVLAKIVNCQRNREAIDDGPGKKLTEPCNKCVSCIEISKSNAIDLIEIDAASNRGIDDIRLLRERVNLAPSASAYKVYIIDEVHMLTREAFNALLKTLEEPPEHVLFILCTTELEKIPDTVLSRATLIHFSKASNEEMINCLKKVVRSEGLNPEAGVLQAIASAVDGSFRDGMKILEQLSLRVAGLPRGKKIISLKDVHSVLGSGGEQLARQFLVLLLKKDRKGAFGLVQEMSKQGASPAQFCRDLLELLRRLLLTEIGVLQEERIEGMATFEIKTLIEIFSNAALAMRSAVIEELPLEVAILEWMEQMESREKILDKVKRRPTKAKEVSGKSRVSPESDDRIPKKNSEQAEDKSSSNLSFDTIIENWPKVLEKLRPQNHSVEALLKAAQPVRIDGRKLVVEVAYAFHKEQLELVRYRQMVEAAISSVIEGDLRLEYVLKERTVIARSAVLKKHENLTGSVEDDDVIRAAEEIFGSE